MEMARKHCEEFTPLESRFAQFRSDWEQHLSRVSIKTVRKENPYSLKPDVWATEQAVSAALH
jgi:hypothetical protein